MSKTKKRKLSDYKRSKDFFYFLFKGEFNTNGQKKYIRTYSKILFF